MGTKKSLMKGVAIRRSSAYPGAGRRDVGEVGTGWDWASRRSRTLALMRSTGEAVGMETLEGNQESVLVMRLAPVAQINMRWQQ
jgi:hypothetical protein